MKIIYVINSAEGGGAAFPVPRIVSALRRHGAEVRLLVLTRRDGQALPRFNDAGVDYVLRKGGRTDHGKAARWLDAEVRRWQPDAIWTSLTRATLLGQLVGRWHSVPVVSWQHAAFLKPANLFLLRAMRHWSHLWIGDSAAISALTTKRLDLPPHRVLTWPIFAANPAAPVGPDWSPGATLQLGSLGRLHPVKGYDLLIEAIAILQRNGFSAPVPWELTIGGEGQQRCQLERLMNAAGITNLHLPGFTDRSEIFLSRLHLYLQPSRGEGFCLAAHEAMQAGLPVIGSAVGELSHSIVDEETGLLVVPENAEALASALKKLLSRPDRLSTMGRLARLRVMQRFSEATFNSAGGAVLERLAGIVREGQSACAPKSAPPA